MLWQGLGACSVLAPSLHLNTLYHNVFTIAIGFYDFFVILCGKFSTKFGFCSGSVRFLFGFIGVGLDFRLGSGGGAGCGKLGDYRGWLGVSLGELLGLKHKLGQKDTKKSAKVSKTLFCFIVVLLIAKKRNFSNFSKNNCVFCFKNKMIL